MQPGGGRHFDLRIRDESGEDHGDAANLPFIKGGVLTTGSPNFRLERTGFAGRSAGRYPDMVTIRDFGGPSCR